MPLHFATALRGRPLAIKLDLSAGERAAATGVAVDESPPLLLGREAPWREAAATDSLPAGSLLWQIRTRIRDSPCCAGCLPWKWSDPLPLCWKAPIFEPPPMEATTVPSQETFLWPTTGTSQEPGWFLSLLCGRPLNLQFLHCTLVQQKKGSIVLADQHRSGDIWTWWKHLVLILWYSHAFPSWCPASWWASSAHRGTCSMWLSQFPAKTMARSSSESDWDKAYL